MSEDSKPYKLEPWREELLSRAFDRLPEDFESRSAAVKAIQEGLQGYIPVILHDALNKHLADTKADTFAEKRQVAEWVDRVTRELGVTVCDIKTGNPALIMANRTLSPDQKRDSGDGSYFTLVTRTGRHRKGIDKQYLGDKTGQICLTHAPPDLEELFADIRPQQHRRRTR